MGGPVAFVSRFICYSYIVRFPSLLFHSARESKRLSLEVWATQVPLLVFRLLF
jgi:hypothetical protein